MSKKNKIIILWCLVGIILLIIMPLFLVRNADFNGTDDIGIEVISELYGDEYNPWTIPLVEYFLGGEVPSEIESFLFCIQTGIGVGIIAFLLGKWTERYKLVSTKKGREIYKEYLNDMKDKKLHDK